MTTIKRPGIYDLPADVYHSDPTIEGSLSFSRAKTLLEEAGPAKFLHAETAPREQKPYFDFGTAAHAKVLGKGSEQLMVIDAPSWRTRAAQDQRREAYLLGLTPILAHEMRTIDDMADALSKHPHAMETLAGDPEVAMFWRDTDGMWLRGQLDVHAPGSHIGDYKTAQDASGAGFTQSAWKFRYHMQAAWYQHLTRELTGELLPFRFVVQEKAAPYLVSVWEPTADYLELGAADMADAIGIYRQCRASGEWPGYDPTIQPLTAPGWALDDEIEV